MSGGLRLGGPMSAWPVRGAQRRFVVRRAVATIGVAVLVLAGPAAADIFEKVGTFDGQFLKIGVGARAEAMGGAFVGVADDATALRAWGSRPGFGAPTE